MHSSRRTNGGRTRRERETKRKKIKRAKKRETSSCLVFSTRKKKKKKSTHKTASRSHIVSLVAFAYGREAGFQFFFNYFSLSFLAREKKKKKKEKQKEIWPNDTYLTSGIFLTPYDLYKNLE